MAARFVLDSSALSKTFLAEEESPAFLDWLRERLSAGDDLLGPTLVAYELGEVVRQKLRRKPADRVRVLESALRLVRVVSHESLMANAYQHADRLTFYDSAFVSLAHSTDATLVTYDRRLAAYATGIGQACLSPGAP